jgi:hypothetical protein
LRAISGPDAEPVDLLAVAGRPALKRIGPVVALGVVLVVLLVRRQARRARREAH